MCAICGCSGEGHDDDHDHGHPHDHEHGHHHHDDHGRHHDHDHRADSARDQSPHAHAANHAPEGRRRRSVVEVEQAILARNDALATENRHWLAARDILAINLVSSPGAGKTTLLERTIRDVGSELAIGVLEGDQATHLDAERIRRVGARAVQINTGAGCHLDAAMVARALSELAPPHGGMVVIENVGNLVCPALFDLGERLKMVVTSVTEGDDKPLKYPYMFRASEVMLVNKIDLLPYVAFDVDRCVAFARSVNPRVRVFQVSATRGDGLEEFYGWLRKRAGKGYDA